MKKIYTLLCMLSIFITSIFTQQPIFKTDGSFIQIVHKNYTNLDRFVDRRECVKYPNVVFGTSQIHPDLTVSDGCVFFQGARNPFTGDYVLLERNRFSMDHSLFTWSNSSLKKTELFNQSNSPLFGKALKPLGFISSTELLLEALIFDSHFDHLGIYKMNLTTNELVEIQIDSDYMTSPILSPDLTTLYYVGSTDLEKDVIHGNYNEMKSFEFLTVENTIIFSSNTAPIDFIGWEPTTELLSKQLKSNNLFLNAKTIVQHLLPWDNGIQYYVSRHGTPAPSGPHTYTGYDPVYLGFNAHGYAAVDFDTPDNQNDNIRASAPGTVTFAGISCGLSCGYGNLVIIEHADGRRTYNAHMSQIIATVGMCVGYGTIIGKEGTTGGSSGDHQHFEWREAGGNASVIGTFDDVGQPRAAYRYLSETPVLACNISSPGNQVTDAIDPTTTISMPVSNFGNWQTANFIANYADADNSGGSGIDKTFYQVIDNNGTSFAANANRGFFADNFDGPAINTQWTSNVGTWNITAGNLTQTNQTNLNTSISAYVKSDLSNRYLYQFEAKIEGTGNNRRAGMHYFADSPTLPNRGNGYFAWFKVDADMIEIYKVTNDVFSLVSSQAFNFNAAQFYDFKITYDRVLGKTQIFIDNTIAHAYTDAAPLISGNYVSFRSSECLFSVNQLKIYRTRLASNTIVVSSTGDIRYSNANPLSPAGRIKSIVTDNAGNISTISSQNVNVDTSIPTLIATVNDGNSTDIDLSSSFSSIAVNWTTSTDVNSGISRYFYSIGNTAGATNLLNWTDNGSLTSATINGLSLLTGTTYFINIKSQNGAGLQSNVSSSDGFMVQQTSNAPTAFYSINTTTTCSNDSVNYTNQSQNALTYSWTFPGGFPATSSLPNPSVYYGTTGNYVATLIAFNGSNSDTSTASAQITVYNAPVSSFSPSATSVSIESGGSVVFTNASTDAVNFTWDFGNGGSTIDDSPEYTFSTAGIYLVTLIATNISCGSDTSTAVITVSSSLGIANETSSVFYVIASSDELYVSSKGSGVYTITLIDATGKIVLNKNVQLISGEIVGIKIDQPISNGIYYCKIQNEMKKLMFLR